MNLRRGWRVRSFSSLVSLRRKPISLVSHRYSCSQGGKTVGMPRDQVVSKSCCCSGGSHFVSFPLFPFAK